MRHVILTKFLFLTRRIHRSPPELSSETDSPSDADAEWKWSEAEESVNRALEKDGPYGWREAAMKGMEEEERDQSDRLKWMILQMFELLALRVVALRVHIPVLRRSSNARKKAIA